MDTKSSLSLRRISDEFGSSAPREAHGYNWFSFDPILRQRSCLAALYLPRMFYARIRTIWRGIRLSLLLCEAGELACDTRALHPRNVGQGTIHRRVRVRTLARASRESLFGNPFGTTSESRRLQRQRPEILSREALARSSSSIGRPPCLLSGTR